MHSRYAKVYLAFLKTCLMREMEFRGHFLLLSLAGLVWTVISLAMVAFIFSTIRSVAGWDLDRMLLLQGTWTLVVSLTNFLFARNMQRLSEYINKGDLDLVLVKPMSSQFLVSTRFVSPHDLPSAVAGLVYAAVAVQRMALSPSPLGALGYLVAVVSAIVCFYSLWFMSVTFVLWTGRINNIAYVVEPVMEMARLPTDVFKGWVRYLLTFVVPVALIATVPSKALLAILDPWLALYAIFIAAALLWASNRFWDYSLLRYSSASS